MANNRTFTELNGDVITNGTYSVRYVMENDSPRFVLVDIVKALGYKSVRCQTNYFCRKLGLGKIVGADNNLRTYATKEQVDLILDKSSKTDELIRKFWNDEVVPATDQKYAGLKKQIEKEKGTNQKLAETYRNLKEENDDLLEKIKALLNQREQIGEILGLTA